MKLLKMGIPAMIAVGGLAYLVLSGSSNGSSSGSSNGSSNGAKGASGRSSSGSGSSHTHDYVHTDGRTAPSNQIMQQLLTRSNQNQDHVHVLNTASTAKGRTGRFYESASLHDSEMNGIMGVY